MSTATDSTTLSQLLDFDDEEPEQDASADLFTAPAPTNASANPLDGQCELGDRKRPERFLTARALLADLLGLFNAPTGPAAVGGPAPAAPSPANDPFSFESSAPMSTQAAQPPATNGSSKNDLDDLLF